MRTLMIILVILIWLLLGWCYKKDYNRCCTEAGSSGEKIGMVDDQDAGTLKDSAEKDVQTSEEATGKAISADGDDGVEDADGAEGTATKPVVDPSRWKGPLTFKWSDKKPIIGNAWNSYKDSLLRALPNDQLLQITGLYRSGEAAVAGFDNLGMARANEVRSLLSELPDDRFRFFSQEIDPVDGDRNNVYKGVSFRSLINTDKIKEIEDKTNIYFPYNSTNKLNDREVEAYLDDVAERIKKSGENVRLIGHTDSFGDPQSNMRMGQWRADVIANYLVAAGVPKTQIITISRGETEPAATNATEEGRAKNRRTELRIIN